MVEKEAYKMYTLEKMWEATRDTARTRDARIVRATICRRLGQTLYKGRS
jgi:hypothetical protein